MNVKKVVSVHPIKDPWLVRWLPLLKERVGDSPVLEIGCGAGEDTQVLCDAGLAVVGFDLSEDQLAKARSRAPNAQLHCCNVLEAFPLEGCGIGVIVASLSLHYFSWATTLELAKRLHATLRPGGVLLCRLNATDDHHFGASGHKEIEPNYFMVNGEPKRFFDKEAVDAMFAEGWKIESLKHYHTTKYGEPKALWEAVLVRA